MGGWGNRCRGNNPGCYLQDNFDAAFPNGATIGCSEGESFLFTSATAVKDFLACGGTQALLIDTQTDPECNDNVFAGQLLACLVNITFDLTFEDFGEDEANLVDLVFTDPAYAGYTVGSLVEEANTVIGGCMGDDEDLDFYVIGLTLVNENFIGGDSNEGELVLPNCGGQTCSCTFYCPADAELDCLDDTSVTANGSPTVSGDCCTDGSSCGVAIAWSHSDTESSDGCVTTITRTFTGVVTVADSIDWGSNDDTYYCHQTLTLTDTTPPVVTISCPPVATVYSDANCTADTHPSVTGYATADIDDLCDPDAQLDPLTYVDSDTTFSPGVNQGCYSFTRTWTASGSDACGNHAADATCTQTIHVADNTPPTIDLHCPADETVYVDANCQADLSGVAHATADFNDNCLLGDTDLTYNDVVTSSVSDGCYTITRTWTASASDACGNHAADATCTQTIHVADNTPPTIDLHCPADETVYVDSNCNADLSGVAHATADFDDNCLLGDTDLSYSDAVTATVSNGCYTITRTWMASASDACGNSAADATCTQLIHVVDTIAPVITTNDTSITAPDIPCHPQLRTQTMGGWGNDCSGDNPGCYLQANFDAAFPNGVAIGSAQGNNLLFTSAQAVIDFLPCGDSGGPLSGSAINPACIDNVLAGQLLAASLNVGFDDAFDDFGESDVALRSMIFTNSAFSGYAVGSFIQEANAVLGGSFPGNPDFYINGLTVINEEYVDGNTNNQGLRNPNCNLDCETWTYDHWVGLVPAPPASDNCDGDVTATLLSIDHEVVDGVPSCILTWTADDGCGNTGVAEQIVQVVDTLSLRLFNLPGGDLSLDSTAPDAITRDGNDADDVSGPGSESNPFNLEDVFPIRVLKVAPNPTDIAARIQFTSSEAVKLTMNLIQLDGTVVRSLFNGDVFPDVIYNEVLAVDGLETGIYHVRWATDTGVMTRKILVTH